MTVPERVVMARRAEELLRQLEQHDDVTRGQLGRARDLLNTVCDRADAAEVHTALQDLEDLVERLVEDLVDET